MSFMRLNYLASVIPKNLAAFPSASGLLHTSRPVEVDINKRGLPKGFRPPGAYALFCKDVYQPGMKIPDLGRIAASKWKSLPEDKIQEYKDKAAKILVERKKEFDALPDDKKLYYYEKQDAERKIRKLRRDVHEPEH